MSFKVPFSSYINLIVKNNGWDDDGDDATIGCNIIPSWELDPPAAEKEVIWGAKRDAPELVNVKLKEAKTLSIETANLGELYPLYALFGDREEDPTGDAAWDYGLKIDNSNVVVDFEANINGSEYKLENCVIDEAVIDFPSGGGNITMEYTAIVADIDNSPASIGEKTQATNEISTADATYTIKKDGTAINDLFKGGSITFKNNYNYDAPDLENNHIAEPYKGQFEIEFEADFRIHEDDNFINSYLDGDKGVFSIEIDASNGDGDGIYIEIDGLGLMSFKEPVPTAEDGVIEQTVTFENMENDTLKFYINNILSS